MSTVITNPPWGFSADSVRSVPRLGIPGAFLKVDPAHYEEGTGVNEKPAAADVWTVLVGTNTNSYTYVITLDGVTSISYTSDASATKAEIAEGIQDAWNAEPIARRVGAAVTDGVDTVTITGLWKGVSFTVATTEAKLTVSHATTADDAEDIDFGRMVFSQGYATNSTSTPAVFNAKSTYFSAQVATFDYTYASGQILGVRCINKGTGKVIAEGQVVQGTSKDATTTAIAGVLNGMAPAVTVVFTNAGATGYELVCTAELAGLEFAVEFFSDDATAIASMSVTDTTGPSPSTSILRALAGISGFSDQVAAATVAASSVAFEGGRPVRYLKRGQVVVSNAQSPSFSDTVYVEMDGTGANFGKLYNSSSSTRLPLPKSVARWERYSSNSADALAVLTIDATATY